MGAPRKLLRRFLQRRLQVAVLVQVQLFVQIGRLTMHLHKSRLSLAALLLGATALAGTHASLGAQAPNMQAAVNAAHAKFRTLKEGKNADYIPALAKVDPDLFGIVLVTVDGKVFTAGDVKTEVSIQSISKVFTM